MVRAYDLAIWFGHGCGPWRFVNWDVWPAGLVASSAVPAGAGPRLCGIPGHYPVRRPDSSPVDRRRLGVVALGPTIPRVNLLAEWGIRHPEGSVAECHGAVGAITSRAVLRHQVHRATVVLGSGQRDLPGSGFQGLSVGPRRGSAPLWRGCGLTAARRDDVGRSLLPRGDPLWDETFGGVLIVAGRGPGWTPWQWRVWSPMSIRGPHDWAHGPGDLLCESCSRRGAMR
ncbi:MAG: hypothetical protein CM1200mP26_22490 [Acidimicrobiales bacterium]|nr:MAG: hypothetical protein CM1200mP26_22490 [Acidimicrobiales bacterium]